VSIWALTDLATPWCIHVVVTLRVAEHIDAGITEIAAIAAAAHADADSLHRVLRHLVGKGLFEEPSPGHFALNDDARVLLEPFARHGFDLDQFGGRMAHSWSTLLTAVRTGKPAYHEVFGRPFWDDLAAHPEIAASFDALMGPGHGTPDANVLVDDDWDSVHAVADVGGGTGSLLAEILRGRPHLRGTLIDLPATIERSQEVFAAAGVSERVTAVGQSFFDPLPAGLDLIVLKSVLSDWSDREATTILRRCADAVQPNGRVVLLNGVKPDEDGPADPALLMMVLVGGRDRTLTEFRTLAREAGLRVSASARQTSGRFIVECHPGRV
jgi:2,7-dihydroxy-5-methyl-1-naphthoate 7-O-methyltransferase